MVRIMTCKDCLYWARCHSRISYVMDYDETGKEITDIENHCKGFVDKSRYVEVVRCKDCKHFCPYEGEEHKGDCEELVGLESCVYEDDFCSYGERRKE